MARKKKRPWNADLKTPGLLDVPETPPPKPLRGQALVGRSTPGAPPEDWECLRCEQIRDGREPIAPDHTPRCKYRGTGRDPEPKG